MSKKKVVTEWQMICTFVSLSQKKRKFFTLRNEKVKYVNSRFVYVVSVDWKEFFMQVCDEIY